MIALAGCALGAVAGRVAGLSGATREPNGVSARIEPGPPAPLPPGTLPAGKGSLVLTVRWPERRGVQRIPDSADNVLFDVSTPGDVFVASTSVTRQGGVSTATSSLELDAGDYRLNAGARAASTVIATASAPFAVVAGARTALGLTLAPSYLPSIDSFQGAWGLPGDSVTITGTNLGLSWAATPDVKFTTGTGSASATVTAFNGNTLTVAVPTAATSGVVSVAVDGSATTSPTFTVPTPALWALETPVASAGDTIFLDGGFGRNVTVNFPGGQAANAEVLGPGRARVVLPAGNAEGDLGVTTGGTTSGSFRFRSVPYVLGLGTLFQAHHDQATGGRAIASLAAGRIGFATAVIRGYLYVVGGYGAAGYLDSVERTSMDAASLPARSLTAYGTSTLRAARRRFGSAVIGNWLYVFGGEGSGGLLASVERAQIDGTGNLGNFESLTDRNLVTARRLFGSKVLGNHLYVFGGVGPTQRLTSVERAAIDPDGNLGPFQEVQGVTLARPRYAFGSEAHAGYLYVFGGADTDYLSSFERAPIDGAGNLGTFEAMSGYSLGVARGYLGSAVIGNALWTFGGSYDTPTQYTGAVERRGFDASGNLLQGQTMPSLGLSLARDEFGTAVIGSSLYLLGGGASNQIQKGIERVTIDVSGNLGTFATGSLSLVTPRSEHAGAVLGSSIYVMGGYDGDTTIKSIERAPVSPEGVVGAFETYSKELPSARRSFALVRAGGRVYVVGGMGCCSRERSVIYAPLGAGGAPGDFVDLGNLLSVARSFHAAAVIGDYLYVFGGSDSNGPLASVERATIQSDGSLTAFTDAGVALQTARTSLTVAVVGNYLYVVGGCIDGAQILGGVERARINADGTLADFEDAGVSLVAPRYWHSSAVIGDYLYVFGGNGAPGILASVERAKIDSDGTLQAFQTVTTRTLAAARVFAPAILLRDTLLLLGGSDGTDPLGSVERASLQ